jgi:hypothetical protein
VLQCVTTPGRRGDFRRAPRARRAGSEVRPVPAARRPAALAAAGRARNRLFASDFGYLQDFYRIVNFGDPAVLESVEPGVPFPQELVEVG